MKTKLKFWLASLAALAALNLGAAVPATASEFGTTATEVRVAVSCSADGNFGWNVTVIDGAPYAMYDVHANIGWSDSGGGGTFGYPYIGTVGVGGAGIGTSSTWYGYPGPGTTHVWVDARVAGIYASDSDTC